MAQSPTQLREFGIIFTSPTVWAIRILVEMVWLVERAGETAGRQSGDIKSAMLCRRGNLTPGALQHVLPRLADAGILTGIRGPGGGYALARPPQDISLYDIAKATQTRRTSTREPRLHNGRRASPRYDPLQWVGTRLESFSRTITLADLVKPLEKERGLRRRKSYRVQPVRTFRWPVDKVDWQLPNGVIAKQFGITRCAVWMTRRELNKPPPVKTAPHHDWASVDWDRTNKEIAQQLGCSGSMVDKARKRVGRPRVRPLRGGRYQNQILHALADGPKCVSQIMAIVGLISPVVSKHLRILRERRMVTFEKKQQRVYYSLVADGKAQA
jgi:Rrf2 family transcriptional regulator, iron-sulfur cluster assembly transcription factor